MVSGQQQQDVPNAPTNAAESSDNFLLIESLRNFLKESLEDVKRELRSEMNKLIPDPIQAQNRQAGGATTRFVQ